MELQGALNERAQGLHTKIPPKPEPLVRYEQAKSLGIPYVQGGLEDQPYLWITEHGLIVNFLAEQDAIRQSRETQDLIRNLSGGANAQRSAKANW